MRKAERLFREAYNLAFESKSKRKILWDEAFKLWNESAQLGHISSIFYLATCYDFGHGVKEDREVAFKYYLQASELGHRDSQFNVG